VRASKAIEFATRSTHFAILFPQPTEFNPLVLRD